MEERVEALSSAGDPASERHALAAQRLFDEWFGIDAARRRRREESQRASASAATAADQRATSTASAAALGRGGGALSKFKVRPQSSHGAEKIK